MDFPAIDPVVFCIGPIALRWYALAYIGGIFICWRVLKSITRAPDDPVGHPPLDAMLNAGIIGIILGGRLGYVLFYNPAYFFANPAEIIAVWQGGLSFHGGALGFTAAAFITARRYGVRFRELMDILLMVAPIGLFFGRIANFINAELYGRPTDLPWGVVFPQWQGGTCDGGWVPVAGEVPRHPSQLYEAGLEGLLLLVVLFILYRRGARQYPGLLMGVFFIGYALARGFVEFLRTPEIVFDFATRNLVAYDPALHENIFAGPFVISMGQILCLPMIIAGIIIIALARKTTSPQLPQT